MFLKQSEICLILTIIAALIKVFQCHGMLISPVNRSTRWRYNSSAPINYSDSQLFCGGYTTQHIRNKGKCGICGDNYVDKRPRANELGGRFGEGVVVETYKSKSVITTSVRIIGNHKGHFVFDLCNMDPMKLKGLTMEDETCFKYTLLTIDGQKKYVLPTGETKIFDVEILLPRIRCKHCVFRWTYVTGNKWGTCSDKTQSLGCGPQETFRGCADIAII